MLKLAIKSMPHSTKIGRALTQEIVNWFDNQLLFLYLKNWCLPYIRGRRRPSSGCSGSCWPFSAPSTGRCCFCWRALEDDQHRSHCRPTVAEFCWCFWYAWCLPVPSRHPCPATAPGCPWPSWWRRGLSAGRWGRMAAGTADGGTLLDLKRNHIITYCWWEK